MEYGKILENNIGNRVFLRRRSNKDYLIMGTLQEVDHEAGSFYVCSDKDQYFIDFEDIYSLDIKAQ